MNANACITSAARLETLCPNRAASITMCSPRLVHALLGRISDLDEENAQSPMRLNVFQVSIFHVAFHPYRRQSIRHHKLCQEATCFAYIQTT